MKAAFEAVGDVRDVDLLAAFVDLWRRKAAGLVSFSRAGASAAFGIAEGDVVSVSSAEARFESSAILVRAGKLDAAALERLSVTEGADGALAALQAGILTKREWRWGEKIRGIEVLADLLSWPEGKYYFDADVRPAPGEFTVAIPRLLLELFLRSRDRNLIEHQLGRPDATLVRSEDFDREFSTFGLTADAESVVRMIDGKATADEIARGAPADEFAVRKLLGALVTLGLLRAAETEAAGLAPTTSPAAETETPVDAGEGPERRDAPPWEDAESLAATKMRRYPEDETSDAGSVVPTVELPGEAASAGYVLAAPAPPQASVFDLDPTPPSSLESFSLPGAREGGPDAPEPPGFDPGPVFEPLPPSREAAAPGDSRRTGGVGPFVWVIAGLAVLTGAVLYLRSRTAASAVPGEPTPPTATASASAPTSAPAAGLISTAAPPPAEPKMAPASGSKAAAPTTGARPASRPGQLAPPAARTAASRPTAPPPATPAAARSALAAATASVPSAGRSEWVAKAGRDRARLKSQRGTRFAIQLELACEVPSLSEAWKHDRPAGSMWLLTSRHGSKDCFRVLWGRYRTLDAARRAKSGIPTFFSTPSNHPAVVSVP